MMQRIGLLCNPRLATAAPLAEAISAWLTQRGMAVWMEHTAKAPTHPDLPQTDLLITLGGDGTVLRAVPAAVAHEVPIAGVHLGRVGFLTETTPDHWEETLAGLLEGRGWLDERALVQVTLLRKGYPIFESEALNEAVVARAVPVARVIRVHATIDGVDFGEHVADALMVATATGSTAYAAAAGGPVLTPWLPNLVWVPVAPYLTPDRALVLGPDAHIELNVLPDVPEALTLDGQTTVMLEVGDKLVIRRSPRVARFLRLRPCAEFYRVLAQRTFLQRGRA